MKEIRFSINSWIFGNTPIEEVARRAQSIGVWGLDINGEPDLVDVGEIKQALKKHSLAPACVSGNFLEEARAFNHSDPAMRCQAVEYGKKCVDLAVQVGVRKVLMVPSQVFKPAHYISQGEDWKNAVAGLRELAEYAATQGDITILLECVNKYEVSLVRTIEDGIKMIEDIAMDNVKLTGDTFHMYLEEDNGIHNALRKAGIKHLAHLHLGDNTREVPGKGCINWREVMIALNDIGYEEVISFEPLPHRLSPEEIFNGALDPDELDRELTFSVNFLKSVMQSIR